MPTYEYHCNACNEDLDVFQSMKEEPLTVCPSCKKKGNIHRRISGGAGLIFKGSGFYETDYKRSPDKKGESSEASKSDAKEPKPKVDKPKKEPATA